MYYRVFSRVTALKKYANNHLTREEMLTHLDASTNARMNTMYHLAALIINVKEILNAK